MCINGRAESGCVYRIKVELLTASKLTRLRIKVDALTASKLTRLRIKTGDGILVEIYEAGSLLALDSG